MSPSSAFLPMMVLVGWTMTVLMLIPYQRFRAGFAGRVSPDDFRLGESARVPPEVSLPNRNFMNLLEVPLLFYVLSFVQILSQHTDRPASILAWSYVALRVVHSLIHLSYNRVQHRLLAYGLSNLVLAASWWRLIIALYS